LAEVSPCSRRVASSCSRRVAPFCLVKSRRENHEKNLIKVTVQDDLKKEETAMAEYGQYCDDTQSEKGFAIRTAAKDINRYEVRILSEPLPRILVDMR
jgi:hypothetical protein